MPPLRAISGDPETQARIAQYETAFRMKTASPELVDIRSEPANLLEEYGPDAGRPCAALLRDLKRRGLLDETLVIWGGEFGRTVYCQGNLSAENYGRDHHGRCFSMWLAGGGIRPGIARPDR